MIRDELGLAYSVGGGMTDSADIEAGYVPRSTSELDPMRPIKRSPPSWNRFA